MFLCPVAARGAGLLLLALLATLASCSPPPAEDPALTYPVVRASDGGPTLVPAVGATPTPTEKNPASSPESAATTLLEAWRAGNRAHAGTVATREAVDELFDLEPGATQSRGCQQANQVRECAYRLGGGLLKLTVAESEGGWIVHGVEAA